ncbi:MAG: WbqC family protein [Bacteroidales bacterium]|nr:WbqC family protein [Bacteroidales bacterium]MBN2820503.1 WbqC family protein [Bacteroidales bacterium]
MQQIKETAILSTAYLPNIQYVSKFMGHKKVIIDIHETYQKQSYRNRTSILGANGKLDLTIPVVKQFGNSTKTKDILIEYETNWQSVHWKAIVSAYGHSPFFEIFEAELAPLFIKKTKYLVDFNTNVLLQLFESLGKTDIQLNLSEKYILTSREIIDYRDSIHPKQRMQIPDSHFKAPEYFQVFAEKHEFISNLSFLDLIFNEGSQALYLCQNSFLV